MDKCWYSHSLELALRATRFSPLDYDPVEVERRTWTSTTIATYWLSDLVSIVGWSQAAAMYHVGLSATDATLACMVAGICISVPTGRLYVIHLNQIINIRSSAQWEYRSFAACPIPSGHPSELWDLFSLFLRSLKRNSGFILVWHPQCLREQLRDSSKPTLSLF